MPTLRVGLFSIFSIILISLLYLTIFSKNTYALIYDCAAGESRPGYCNANPDATRFDCGFGTIGFGQDCCNAYADNTNPEGDTAQCQDSCFVADQTCSLDSQGSCLNSSCFGQPQFCCNYSQPAPAPAPLPAECSRDSDCTDSNPCTIDYCLGSGSPGSLCVHNPASEGSVCLRDSTTFQPQLCCSADATCNVNCAPAPPPSCPAMTCSYSQTVSTSVCESGTQLVTGTGCTGFNCGCQFVSGCSTTSCTQPSGPPPTDQCGSCSALTPACGETTAGADNCGNPCSKTGPACTSSCSVSWTLSDTNPPPNSTVTADVTGTSIANASWTNVAYSLDGGAWNSNVQVTSSSIPTFRFTVPSGSANPYSLRFAIGNGSTICTPPSSFITQAPPPAYYQVGGKVSNSTGNPLGNVCLSVYNDTNGQQTKNCNSVSSLLTNANGNWSIDSFIRGGDAFAVRAPGVPLTLGSTTYTNKTGDYENQSIFANKLDYNFTYTAPNAPPSVTLSATSPITSGSQTTLSWDISGNAQSCAVANSGTPAITSGSWSGTLTGTEVSNGNHTRPITMTSTTSTAKTFNISCTNADGTSPTSSTPVIVNPSGLPPAPTVSTARVTNSCINPNHSGSDVDIAWTNSGVSWVNISTDASFGSYYHKSVAGSSTTAPNGFNLNPSNPPQPLTLNPNTTYYVRTWNNTQHSAVASFSLSACSGGPGPTTPPPGGGCGGSLSVAGHSAPATFSTSYRSTVSIAASAPTCFSVTLPDGNTQTTCSGSFNRNFDLSNVGPGTWDVSMTNRAWGGTCSLNVTINAQQYADNCREQSSWSILTYAFNDSTYSPNSWPSYGWRQDNNNQCFAGNRFKTSQTCKTNSECNDGNTCTINDTCSGYRAEYCNDDERCYPERMGICTYENQVPYTVCTKDAGGNPTKLCSTNSCSGYQPADEDHSEVLGTCPANGQSACSVDYVTCTDPKRNDQYCCGTTNIQGKGCQGQCNLTYYEGSPAKAGIVVHADGDQCGLNFTRTTDSGGKANFNPPRTVGSGRWGAIPSRVNYTVWAEIPSGQPFTRGTCSNTFSSIDPPALVTVTGNRAACGITLSGGGFNAGRASFGFGVPAAPAPSTCSGNIILTLVPNPTLPLTTITAASSGLISCTSKPITIRTPDCNGVLAASCTSGTSGCNANLVVPPTAGTYTYAACIDKTSPPDGDYTDPGESDTTTLTVNPPGSSANSAWIQTTGGDVHSNVRIYTPGGP